MSNLTLTPYVNDISRNWVDTTSSSDGKVLAACVYYGYIYTSYDYGVKWANRINDSRRYWRCIACSSNGSKMVAAIYGGQIYTSTNYGTTWSNNNDSIVGNWISVASSDDGVKLVACTAISIMPTSIPNLQLWLDAKDYSTLIFSGSYVSIWNDKSGYGYNATPFNPTGYVGFSTYNPIGLNNLPAIQLTKTGFSAKSPIGTFINGMTFFVVFKKTGTVDSRSNEALISKTLVNQPSPFDIYSDKKMVSRFSNSFINIGEDSNGNPVGTPCDIRYRTDTTLYSTTLNKTQWKEYINGNNTYTNEYTTDIFRDGADYIYIGTRADRYTSFEGVISEVIVYNRVLTTDERELVERYLAIKWKITTSLTTSSTDGYIYTSTNSGANWTRQMSSDLSRNWTSVTSSSDGTRIVACVANDYLYTSSTSGLTWNVRMNDLYRNWSSVTSSSDGTRIVACVNYGYLYTSTDFGLNWTPRMGDLSRNWSSVTSSRDGVNLFATVMNSKLYTSNNYGQNWIDNDLSRNWSSITLSKMTLISSVNDGYLYILNLLTYYNKIKIDLANYYRCYVRREDLLSIQPSSQSLTLNSGGFKMNNILIDKTFSFYKHGTRKNSFFKVNNVDIGSLFQYTDVSYVYINITTQQWNRTPTTFTNAEFIWSNSSLPTQQKYAEIYKHFFYYSFYYTQPDISGNIYATCNNAAIQIGFNGGASGQFITDVNNGVWSTITPSSPTPSSITIKKGLNCIKIGVYNNRIPSLLIANFDASFNVTSSSSRVSKWTSINNSANYLEQTTLNYRPVITQNFINSYPAINFSDISGSLLKTNTSKISTSEITLFFVIKLTGHKQKSQFCSTNSIWKSGSLHLSFMQNVNLVTSLLKISFYAVIDNSYDWVTPLTVPTNSPYILTINISNSVAKYRYNGIPEETTYTYGTTTPILANLDIGGWSEDLSRNFLGGIGEFIQYNRTLSLIEMQQVEYYLALKWGISSFGPSQSVQNYSIGLYCYFYNNYYFDNSYELFQTRPYTLYNRNITNFVNHSSAILNTNIISYTVQNYSTCIWYGLFKSPYYYPKDISFGLKTDDASYLWFGDNAMEGNYTKANANIDNGGTGLKEKQCSINVVNDIYYPIRIIYGQRAGPPVFQFYYIIPETTTKVYDLSDVVFYPSNPDGLIVSLYDNNNNCIAYTNENWTYSVVDVTFSGTASNSIDDPYYFHEEVTPDVPPSDVPPPDEPPPDEPPPELIV